MANIAEKMWAIRHAIFGRDVRENIASGIEAINTEVENTTARQEVIDSQEQSRKDAENIRITNENTRKIQETDRQNAESIRQTTFNTNENTRQTTFTTNETTRINTFNTNEATRQTNETTRQSNENIRIQNENDRLLEFGNLRNEITTSVNNANTAATNTNTATSNYMNIVEQTRKIYKPLVNTYNDISTTYPTPEIGWTVVAKDTSIEYRWDGTTWVSIGVSDVFDGYNIVLGTTPPNDPNLIWLDCPENNRNCRIIPSTSQPTDTAQIWWETDN